MATRRDGELGLWLNGHRVGTWRIMAGRHQLEYAPDWLDSALRRPVSLSLPLLPAGAMHEGPGVESYFENLLPDDPVLRRRVAQRFGARSTSAFDLLEHVGHETAGALQILRADHLPGDLRAITGEPLSEAAVAQHLRTVRGRGSSTSVAGFRISLAGAHAKTALLWHEGRWHLPTGATPSTHLLKLPLGRVGDVDADLSDSVENEWLCARIVAGFGIEVASSRIERFEDELVLVVERFDRRAAPDGRWIQRIPQEDTCQALGIAPERKYESDGGPGIRAIMRLLESSSRSEVDRRWFFTAQVLYWLLAAVDGHAKNFSLAIEALGRFHMTPLYDIVSAHPVMGRGPHLIEPREARMAMALWGTNRHHRRAEIQRRHFGSTAAACRLPGGAEPIIHEVLATLPGVLTDVARGLPRGFPARVADRILDGTRQAADRLASMPPT